MKALSTLLIILSLSVQAQVASNDHFELSAGYSSGHYTVSVKNKMNCALTPLRVSWLQSGTDKDTTFNAAALQTIQFLLPAPNTGSTIKIKSDAPCSSNGWLSLTLHSALAITDNRIRYLRQLQPNTRALFSTEGMLQGIYSDGQKLPKGFFISYRNGVYSKILVH